MVEKKGSMTPEHEQTVRPASPESLLSAGQQETLELVRRVNGNGAKRVVRVRGRKMGTNGPTV